MLARGRQDLKQIGTHRTHKEAMQVISGPIGKQRMHFEAPPSKGMRQKMKLFITWFNDSGPESRPSLPALMRAGIAHLYFVSIHTFEDGNGRIGRAIAEKSLSQCLGSVTN
jgi:Fic family protein